MDAGHDLVAHLLDLEEELLRPEVRRSAAALDARLAPDFVEFGSSGLVYDRATIIAALRDEAPALVLVEGFAIRLMAPDVALATYRSVRVHPEAGPAAPVLRSSIWRREGDTWRMAFHQGTSTR